MSSAVVSTPAALGRPFVFDDYDEAEVGSLASASRAALNRTAPSTPLRACPEPVEGAGLGDCPHINLYERQGVQESSLARVQSAIKNQQSKILPARVTPASQLDIRPAPVMVSSGAPAIDALTGGLPRGCLTEICGPASSGRTTLLLAALAAATRRGEFCAVIDASDALDPHSAAASGVELDHLLWVRCGEDTPQKSHSKPGCPISRAPFARKVGTREVHSQAAFDFDHTGSKENSSRQSEHRLEQVLRATDLLLESGGFGLIVLDLGDLPPQSARYIPLTTWFRFRRAIEHTPTILLAIEQHPIAGSCSSLLLQLGATDESAAERRKKINLLAKTELDLSQPTHTHLLTGLNITAELIRSRLDRKPTRSVAFATKTAWAG
jgi:hypothetical protein